MTAAWPGKSRCGLDLGGNGVRVLRLTACAAATAYTLRPSAWQIQVSPGLVPAPPASRLSTLA